MDHKICPFYMNKDRAQGADLILMSYNYMLYESMRPTAWKMCSCKDATDRTRRVIAPTCAAPGVLHGHGFWNYA